MYGVNYQSVYISRELIIPDTKTENRGAANA